ncbi:MAG: adenylate/guanylate cyclase domain-containing protein [Deltaproteobacteria bacterium]|nr:MAG: adenylate/guanylate cyclase domain-containing protein [Deltaproteobacteria bacterium]
MKKKKIYSIIVALFLFFSFCLWTDSSLFSWLELKTIDWRFGVRGSIPTSGKIVVVTLDEKSLDIEGRWPWSRTKMADLLRKLQKYQPKLVEMDIVFAEESAGDKELAQVIHQNDNTVLGYFFFQSAAEREKASIRPEKMDQSFKTVLASALPDITDVQKTLKPMAGLVSNIPILATAAKSQGYFNAFADKDGVIRRAPLMITYQNKIFPSMTLKTFSLDQDGFDPVLTQDPEGLLMGMSIGLKQIPTNTRGEVMINYRGRDAFETFSATDILHESVSQEALKDKIVLIGATAIGIYDLRVTPISSNLPGIFVQASLLDNLIKGDFLTLPILAKLLIFLEMFVMSLLFVFVLNHPKIKMIWGLLLVGPVLALQWYTAVWFFKNLTIVPFVVPSLYILITVFAIIIYRGLTEERKRFIRTAFQSYLHPDLVEEMTQNLDKLKLGGEKRECTILFSDVRNFTSISENMDPVVLLELMNSYFDPVSQAIIEEGGYIDKFIGDAVMAIFGAPAHMKDHAARACRASLKMKKIVKELEPQFREKYGIEAFKIGIGLNTGDVTVGNIGTSKRLNYTVMGDAVKLASRLESATKELGVEACMSEATYNQSKNEIEGRYLEEISVKGKAQKIQVYEILSLLA